jgi:hypothetical protein
MHSSDYAHPIADPVSFLGHSQIALSGQVTATGSNQDFAVASPEHAERTGQI